MTRYGLLLAPCVLALVMLVVCDRPLGLPDEAHTASVAYCTVADDDDWTGNIYHYEDGGPSYGRDNPYITWLDNRVNGQDRPRQNGFCVFWVPYIDGEDEIFTCSLFYRQKQNNVGENHARLVVTQLWGDPRVMSDDFVFWDAWYGDSIAGDPFHEQDTWYAIPLSTAACAEITDIADGGGGTITPAGLSPTLAITYLPRPTGLATPHPESRSCISPDPMGSWPSTGSPAPGPRSVDSLGARPRMCMRIQ